MTPAGVSKGFMTADMMVVTDFDGQVVDPGPGARRPSTEIQMHLEAYRSRPDVNAVVHAHPPLATGFAVAGIALDRAVLAEVVTTLGSIPIAEYGTPSTRELPAAVGKFVKAHDGMLLANHGAVTCGATVMNAHFKMETIEHFAKISLVARLLGREHLLSRDEVGRLQGLRGMYGIASPAPVCADPSEAGLDQALCQVLEAPASSNGRLVPDVDAGRYAASMTPISPTRQRASDGEIRLTYAELTALIADAIKNLRD
jgi:L-fuculose-phosphate aldolase